MDSQHLKVKRHNICLTKNYCITISIQKISSIHKFMLKIKQSFGSQELKGCGRKIIESTFSFSKFVPACNKSVYFICSCFRYSQFYSPVTRLATSIINQAHPKNVQSLFNLCKFVAACKNQLTPSVNFGDTVNFIV